MSIRRAGPICGNPTRGLCFRECIEVTKVFDGCISRFQDIAFTVTVPDTGAPLPYTFLSARSNGPTTVSNLTIFPSDERRSHVAYDATIPVAIAFTDGDGREHTVPSAVTIHRDVDLNLPTDSLTPFSIKVTSALVSTIGSFTSPTEVTFRCCLIQVTKVTAQVDMLVPSYGYCEYPDCGEIDMCEQINNLPLFPPFA